MIKLNGLSTMITSASLAFLCLMASCTTDDVSSPLPDDEPNLVEISDPALGEYLLYNSQRSDDERLPAGIAVESDGKFYLDVEKATTVTNLYLVKNDTQIKKLLAAGLSTASDKITNLDVLPYFTSLRTLKITSNEIHRIDISKCVDIETIEMNNNLVGSIDMSNATKLVRFRYGSSADVSDADKLSTIDLSNCISLQHLYLKNQNIVEGGLTIPKNYSNLKEMDMSGNPGAPFRIPSDLFSQLTIKNGVTDKDSEPPVKPDERFTIPDRAFGEYMKYLMDKGDLPAGIVAFENEEYKLDKEIAATVTILNVAKTSKIITTLKDAGLSTAETPINNADGLQFFTALTEFTATSNNFTEELPLTTLANLEILQVNTAGVSKIKLSGNKKLRVFNCNGSSKNDKLKTVDLSANTSLETLNLKNNLIETIDISMLKALKEVDLSGNPGADFTIPADIFNNLKTKKGVKSE